MDRKKRKLVEDALQDQTVAPVAAEPATTQEVADATMDAGAPVEDMTAEGEVPAEAAPEAEVAETFTAPMPGMVPSGWINPKDLGDAIAQDTGDVQAAETAEDVQTAENPEGAALTTADTAAGVEQPLVADQATQQQLESLKITKDELNMILEYRKYKSNKLVEEVENPSEEVHLEDEHEEIAAGAPDVVPTEPAPVQEAQEVCPNCGKNPCECEDDMEKVQESEEDEIHDVDDVENLEEVGADDDIEDVEDETADEDVDLVEDGEADEELADDDIDEEIDITDDESDELLARINAFLDDDDPDEVETAETAFENTADFLDSLFDEGDDFEDDEDEEDDFDVENVEPSEAYEDIEEVDDTDDIEDAEDDDIEDVEDETADDLDDDHDFDESRKVRRPRLSEDIIYPAGSERFESEDNLVEAYKRQSAKKREALNSYRNALRGTSRVSESSNGDASSWANNRFEEKYAEHKKFDYKELLKNGFLG